MAELTAERLRELLNYDPETGVFTWRVAQRPGNGGPAQPGKAAGGISQSGYRMIRADKRLYRAHRLAWLWMTGSWPSGEIDHQNGERSDNRWRNLRDVNDQLNSQNQRRPRSDNNSGFLGVCWSSYDKVWIAQIQVGMRNKRLGRFRTPQEAHAAYVAAKRKLHEGCTI